MCVKGGVHPWTHTHTHTHTPDPEAEADNPPPRPVGRMTSFASGNNSLFILRALSLLDGLLKAMLIQCLEGLIYSFCFYAQRGCTHDAATCPALCPRCLARSYCWRACSFSFTSPGYTTPSISLNHRQYTYTTPSIFLWEVRVNLP